MNIYIVAASDAEPDDERRQRWGDYWFKDSLAKALTAEGATVTDNAAEADVVINCHGVGVQGLPEWTYNILWIIGHPDAITLDECAEYDAVFSESARFAEHLREQGVTCGHLPGASDFVPMDAPKTHEAVFVGNYRPGRELKVLDGWKLEVWGEGWGHLPEGQWQGTDYPHEKLNELYASSLAIPNDHHEDMERWGFHNPRHYDWLAVRGETVPTFRDCAKALIAAVPAKRRMYDLGCGSRPRRGMQGIDKQGGKGVLPFNLEYGLPDRLFDREAPADVIVADNLLEHITNLIPLMNNCHDALAPTGRMHLTVPNVVSSIDAAFSDPTHTRAFTPATWDYFNGNHERWRAYGRGYGIAPWRVVYVRWRDRFLDVMLRPMAERKAPTVLTGKGPRVMLSRGDQQWTTGAYVERALVQAGCVVTREPVITEACEFWDERPRYDLYLWVEGGGRQPNVPMPGRYLCPTAGWFIDSHSHLDEHRARAAELDHVFVAQKHLAAQVSGRAVWLPMACDPELHTPREGVQVTHDIAFVGNVYGDHPMYAERRRLLALLAEKYDVRVESGVYFRDMADVYASARVAFNRSAAGDLNMRVFEAMCAGRPLVTDEVPGLDDCLGLNGWALHYRNDDEILDLMEELMSDAAWAEDIGAHGRNQVIESHTYLHRVQTILQAVGL
jgi:SAM-dependent methyltransferase